MTSTQFKAKQEQMNELGRMWLECSFEELDWIERRMEKGAHELEHHQYEIEFYGENWA